MAKGKYSRKRGYVGENRHVALEADRLRRNQGRMTRANQRGIFAVRRRLDPVSYSVFEELEQKILPFMGPKDHIYTPKTLGVTVVGFNRYTTRHQKEGPETFGVNRCIPQLRRQIAARIGELGLFGVGENRKLGFRLVSEELESEIEDIENFYLDAGFPLKPDRHNGTREEYLPHISWGSLFAPLALCFSTARARRSLDDRLGVLGQELILAPLASTAFNPATLDGVQ